MSRRAALYLRVVGSADPRAGRAAVDAWLRGEKFVRWDTLPAGYPASPEEVRELVWRPAGADGGWDELVPEAFQLLFRFALEITERTPDVSVLAVSDRWDGKVAAKLYRGGRVLLKIGEDRDDELTYFIPPPEPEHFADAGRTLGLPRSTADGLASWGRRVVGGEPVELGDLARAFGLPGTPGRFAEHKAAAVAGAGGAGAYELHVHRTSPLYRNA